MDHAPVTQSEILRLYKRFKQLDKDNSDYISTDEFLSIPELAMCPLVMRVLTVFDVDNRDRVTFKQFVKNLGVFHPKADREQKILFAFKVCVALMRVYWRDDGGALGMMCSRISLSRLASWRVCCIC